MSGLFTCGSYKSLRKPKGSGVFALRHTADLIGTCSCSRLTVEMVEMIEQRNSEVAMLTIEENLT